MRKILLLILFLFITVLPSFAKKIPIKIEPINIISTCHDEIEVGDYIEFMTVNDVYKNNKLYIKKGTFVAGKVSHVHPNGWVANFAEIEINNFSTKDVNKNRVIINYTLTIKGNEDKTRNFSTAFLYFLTAWVRGAEINIEPDFKTFNLFVEE